MPKSLRFETKIVGISQVVLEGYLGYVFENDYEGWIIQRNAGDRDELGTWLGKFHEKKRLMRVTIEYLFNEDETHLLPKEE